MNIYLGADHRGFSLKEKLKLWLAEIGYNAVDCGNTVYDKDDDYPDIAFAVAGRVASDPESRGILFCGSGGGVVFAANKVQRVRCVPATNSDDVAHNREHNDANMLGVGVDHTSEDDIKKMIQIFLITPFDPQERFMRRLEKISAREATWSK